jgi:hypothetical protein
LPAIVEVAVAEVPVLSLDHLDCRWGVMAG